VSVDSRYILFGVRIGRICLKLELYVVTWEEKLVGECRTLFNNVTFQVNSGDNLLWNLDLVVGYSVSGTYQLLVNLVPHSQSHSTVSDLIWYKDIPLKISLFAWRLLGYRLSTMVKLFRRDILNQVSQLCVSGCGVIKSANYLFFDRKFFGNAWQQVR